MVDQNTMVGERVEYPDGCCPTQEPLINTEISDHLIPLDEPSYSSQQEPMLKEYNQRNNFAIYDMDAPTGHKLKLCNSNFMKTSSKQKKVDLPTKLKVSCYYKIQVILTVNLILPISAEKLSNIQYQ